MAARRQVSSVSKIARTHKPSRNESVIESVVTGGGTRRFLTRRRVRSSTLNIYYSKTSALRRVNGEIVLNEITILRHVYPTRVVSMITMRTARTHGDTTHLRDREILVATKDGRSRSKTWSFRTRRITKKRRRISDA